jgi:hypothetical protein
MFFSLVKRAKQTSFHGSNVFSNVNPPCIAKSGITWNTLKLAIYSTQNRKFHIMRIMDAFLEILNVCRNKPSSFLKFPNTI